MKRYYNQGVYFITCNTKNRYPFFRHQELCKQRLDDLIICKNIKKFDLHAFCLNYDHFHILIMPDEEVANISEIMRSFKTNCSRNINRLLMGGSIIQEERSRDRSCDEEIIVNLPELPRFSRQKSFHDQIIHDEKSYREHRYYTTDNYINHGLPDDRRWTSKREEWEDLIDYIV